MSKELIERLRAPIPVPPLQWEAAARIEELEREVERLNRIKSRTRQAELQSDNDALQSDNARLRKAIDRQPYTMDREVCEALAATPAQSLARLRNQVREECAGVCDRFAEREMHPAECAAAIRVMKEPE